jgi:hypothetical protein
MQGSMTWILALSVLSYHCAGRDRPDPDSDHIHNVSGHPATSNLENPSKRAQDEMLEKEFFAKGCNGFRAKDMKDIKISGADSLVRLKGDNGLHLKLMVQQMEKEASITIVDSALQSDLQRLCISIPENVIDLKLKINSKIDRLVIKTRGQQARVEIDTGEHGILEKLQVEIEENVTDTETEIEETQNRENQRLASGPQLFLKGNGVRPCQTPSDEYFCE